MTDHPMQPSPEQFADWLAGAMYDFPAGPCEEVAAHIARKAFAAGADAELEACVSFLTAQGWDYVPGELRTARRPKPPSLKERATRAVKAAVNRGDCITQSPALPVIYEALEAMPDD